MPVPLPPPSLPSLSSSLLTGKEFGPTMMAHRGDASPAVSSAAACRMRRKRASLAAGGPIPENSVTATAALEDEDGGFFFKTDDMFN